tara:strand:- start:887 stop:1288 length:402 start_codon:yes stop_codon:yes gene_type:complete
MRPPGKSRNRNKNNGRRPNPGNVINRVFDSAGPEGKVRGTPQQIIDKYLSLAHDSQLSGDRVSAENFQQHSEHYSRLLLDAQKEIAEKANQQEQNNSLEGQSLRAPEKPSVDIELENQEKKELTMIDQETNAG